MNHIDVDDLLWALLDELEGGLRLPAKELARRLSDRFAHPIDRRSVNQLLYAETELFIAEGEAPPFWRLLVANAKLDPVPTPELMPPPVLPALQYREKALSDTATDRAATTIADGPPVWIRCVDCGGVTRGYPIGDGFLLLDGSGEGVVHRCPQGTELAPSAEFELAPAPHYEREIVVDSRAPRPRRKWETVKSRPLPPPNSTDDDPRFCDACGGLLIAGGRYLSCPHCSA